MKNSSQDNNYKTNNNQENNNQDRLIKQIKFIEEIDKEKLIGRQTYLADASRKENDAEHAWHMAIMAVLATLSGMVIEIVKIWQAALSRLGQLLTVDHLNSSSYYAVSA